MAVYDNKVICARVEDVGEAVQRYQDMGCTVKRHSKRGTFVDCTMSTVSPSFYNFETARDEIWTPVAQEQEPQRPQVFEADASQREYYC